MARLRVLIVDDHGVVRAGLAALIGKEPDMEVVGEASSGEHALERVAALRPRVVVMDLRLPGMNGLAATREIKKAFPETDVLVLTVREDPEYFFAALSSGASGYLLKEADPSEIIGGMRTVARGQACFSPHVARLLLQGYREKDGRQKLQEKDDGLVTLAAQGKTNREIAEALSVSIKTIEKRRARVMGRLGLQNRTDLVKYAIMQGLIQPGV